MCGRFGGADEFKISSEWGVSRPPGYRVNYNTSPGSVALVLKKESPLNGEIMKWGLIPSWSKTPKLKFSTFNARSEGVSTSPVFRDSYTKRRCLIPVSVWYEWRDEGEKTKQPYAFKLKSRPAFGLGGLWSEWNDAEGHPLRSFTIITVAANAAVRPYHQRMPLVIPKELEDVWTDHESALEDIRNIMKPYDVDNNLEIYPIHGERLRTMEPDDKRILEPKAVLQGKPYKHPVRL